MPCPDIVESVMCQHKQTGKQYSPFGMPFNFNPNDYQHVSVGFVFRSKDGTTYGSRHATKEAAQAKHDLWESEKAADFRKELEKMSDDALQSQADYWLGKVTA